MPDVRNWFTRLFLVLVAAMPSLLECGHGLAADRSFRLSADQDLIDNGLIGFIVPRFSLKNATRVELVESGSEFDASLNSQGRGQIVFTGPDTNWYLNITGDSDGVRRFEQWLTGETGRKTIAAFSIDGVSRYRPSTGTQKTESGEQMRGDRTIGARLSQLHCGRCHTVDEKTRMSNIGSTPSFGLLRSFPDWQERFLSFYALRPHPAFTLVKDVTPPFDPARPPPIVPIEVTLEEIEAIAAFVSAIEPADLGAPLTVK